MRRPGAARRTADWAGDHRGRDRRRAGRALRRVAHPHAGPARPAVHRGRAAHALGHPAQRESLAARFAAKEALAKALGAPGDLYWHDAEVMVGEHGRPHLEVRGYGRRRAPRSSASPSWHISLSHDGGIASAVVVAEGFPREGRHVSGLYTAAEIRGGARRRSSPRRPRARSCSAPRPGWPRSALRLLGPASTDARVVAARRHRQQRRRRALRRRATSPGGAPASPPSSSTRSAPTRPGLAALRRAGGRVMAAGTAEVAAAIGRADLVLDGMLGIGGRGGLRPDAADTRPRLAGEAAGAHRRRRRPERRRRRHRRRRRRRRSRPCTR